MSAQPRSLSKKVTVIGGGVVGLACAFHLSHAGCAVTVIDRGRLGQGASRGNAGWITPFLSTPRPGPGALGEAVRALLIKDGPARVHPRFDPEFAAWLWRFWRSSSAARHEAATRALQALAGQAGAAYDRLRQAGVMFEMHADGLLVAAMSASTLEESVRLHAHLQEGGYEGDAVRLGRRELSELEPALSDRVIGALHLKAERHVRPETVTEGLAACLRSGGAAILEGRQVVSLTRAPQGAWRVRLHDGELVTADCVLVAAGLHSKELLGALGVTLPLEPAKGVSVTARGIGTRPRHPLKLAEAAVACSPFQGVVRLSGTFDLGNYNAAVDRGRLDAVVRSGLAYLRDWRPESIEFEWAGLRPVTPDDLPVIGPVPGRDGLYVATGHGMLGVTLAAITAEIMAPLITEGRLRPETEPFGLERFTRESKRAQAPGA